jgi:hypothetical protein
MSEAFSVGVGLSHGVRHQKNSKKRLAIHRRNRQLMRFFDVRVFAIFLVLLRDSRARAD